MIESRANRRCSRRTDGPIDRNVRPVAPRRTCRRGRIIAELRSSVLVKHVGALALAGCLTRGVTLYYALRRAGDDVSLCFGVGDDEGQVAGHCWLDRAGEAILERVDPLTKFTEVVRLTPDGLTN